MYKAVIDSGKRQTFETGSKRDIQKGKGRYDLLPFYAMERLATHYENGATKYGDRNWELGQPLTRYVDSCLRHISKWMQGYNEEDHLAAGVWNLLSAIYTEEKIKKGELPKTLLEGLPGDILKQWNTGKTTTIIAKSKKMKRKVKS